MKNSLVLLILVMFISCNTNNNKKQAVVEGEKIDNSNLLNDTDSIIDIINDDLKEDKKKNPLNLELSLQENRTIQDYKNNILKISKIDLSNVNNPNILESMIPINDEEFGYFYSLSYPEDYPESNIELYRLIDSLMLENAIKDRGKCLYLYLNLVEFVDGEYADYYFEVINDVVQRNVDKFCNIYASLSDRSKERLNEIYNETCIQNQN